MAGSRGGHNTELYHCHIHHFDSAITKGFQNLLLKSTAQIFSHEYITNTCIWDGVE